MTDPRSAASAHLDAATIAAFVDRTLDPAARAAAEAHLAACADCREVWVETSEVVSEAEADAGGGTVSATERASGADVSRSQSRRWIYGGAGLAAAAALVAIAVVWTGSSNSVQQLTLSLQPVSQTHRFSEGRLSVSLPWLPPPAETRGADERVPVATLEAAGRLRALADEQESKDSLQAAAIGLMAIGERDEAVELLARAVQLAPNDAGIRSDLAAGYLELWRFSSQTTYAARALDEARRATMIEPAYAPAVFNLALALDAFGLTDEARRAWTHYLSIDPASAWADEVRRRLESVKETTTRSLSDLYLDIETRVLPRWAVGETSDLMLRTAARRLGTDADGAIIDLTQEALKAEAGAPGGACLAAAVRHLAGWTVAFEAGQSQRALDAAEAAARDLRCAGLSPLDAEARRAVSLLELGRFDEADAAAARVLQSKAHQHYMRARARAWQIRGLVSYQRAEFSDALEAARVAAGEAARALDAEFGGALQAHLADLLSIQGDVAGAWHHLAAALAAVQHTRSPRRRYSTLARASISALELRLPGAGLALADAVIRSSADWSNPVGQAFGYLKRAEALGSMGHRALVPSNIAFAQQLAARIDTPAVRAELDAQAQTTHGLLAPGADAVTGAALDDALGYFVKSDNRIMQAPALLARGRWKAARGDTTGAESDWLKGLRIVEDERPEIRDAQLQVSRLDRVWELYEELIDTVERRDPDAALAISERGRARRLLDALARHRPLRQPLAGPAMRTWLPSDTRALVYSVLPNRLIVWDIKADSTASTSQPVTQAQLESLVDRHLSAVRSGTSSPALQRLSELLIPRDVGGLRTLLIVPDGPLHRLPFSSLTTLGDRPLMMDTTVLTAPSLTAAQAVSGRAHRGPLIPLLVGASLAAPESGLPRLAGVPAEIANIRSVYPTATVMLNDAAEPSAVLARMSDHPIFHFSGHAVADPVYPRRSRLIMSSSHGERSLSAAEISSARLQPGTVVILAGCDTANGEIYRGEGMMALSRAFVEAGASAVVGTLWKLDDESAAGFLADFHRAFVAEGSAPEALAVTQREWAVAGREPSIWAAFQVTGGLSFNQEGK